jgi:hypothetical protein
VPGVVDIAAGVNSSVEGKDKGFNYGLFVRFTGAAARDVYLTHPNHVNVVTEYMPILEDLIVVDFNH